MNVWFLLLFLLLWEAVDSLQCESPLLLADGHRMMPIAVGALLVGAPRELGLSISSHTEPLQAAINFRHEQGPTRPRTRRTVSSVFCELGPCCVKRACRMDEDSFWDLHRLLGPHLQKKRKSTSKKKHKDGARNGIIATDIRLSVALRCFAGGSPCDVSVAHGISHTEVFCSVWRVVDAVNACKELAFSCPACHDKQREIARGFAKKSKAGFECCAGAADGMLLQLFSGPSIGCGEKG